MIVLCGFSFLNKDIKTLRMNSFYVSFYGQVKHVLNMRVCSTSTAVTSGHGITLMLSVNVGLMSASMSAFGLESSGTLLWALSAT
jgi:hypothetical protein